MFLSHAYESLFGQVECAATIFICVILSYDIASET